MDRQLIGFEAYKDVPTTLSLIFLRAAPQNRARGESVGT